MVAAFRATRHPIAQDRSALHPTQVRAAQLNPAKKHPIRLTEWACTRACGSRARCSLVKHKHKHPSDKSPIGDFKTIICPCLCNDTPVRPRRRAMVADRSRRCASVAAYKGGLCEPGRYVYVFRLVSVNIPLTKWEYMRHCARRKAHSDRWQLRQ